MRQHKCGAKYEDPLVDAAVEVEAASTPYFNGTLSVVNVYADISRLLSDRLGSSILAPTAASELIFNRERADGESHTLIQLLRNIDKNWKAACAAPAQFTACSSRHNMRQVHGAAAMLKLNHALWDSDEVVASEINRNICQDSHRFAIPDAMGRMHDAVTAGTHRVSAVLNEITHSLALSRPHDYGDPAAQIAALERTSDIVLAAVNTQLPPKADMNAPLTFPDILVVVALERIANVHEFFKYGAVHPDRYSRTPPLRLAGALLSEMGIGQTYTDECQTIAAESVAGVQMREMHETFRYVYESLVSGDLRDEALARYYESQPAVSSARVTSRRAHKMARPDSFSVAPPPAPTAISQAVFADGVNSIKPLFTTILDQLAQQIRVYDGFAPEANAEVQYAAPPAVLAHWH